MNVAYQYCASLLLHFLDLTPVLVAPFGFPFFAKPNYFSSWSGLTSPFKAVSSSS